MKARSIRVRLMMAAFAWIGVATIVAGLTISSLFIRHVVRTAEEDLTHHLNELIGHTRLDRVGRPLVVRPLSDPRFQQIGSGMAWQIDASDVAPLISVSRAGAPLFPEGGEWMVERHATAQVEGRPLRFRIREDGRLLAREINEARYNLALSLAVLMAMLILGVALQLRFGLRPLERLADAIDALRRGTRHRLPDDGPPEFQPLVGKLNELLNSQAVLVGRGRREAGNLAHAIRTPLALIGDEVDQLREAGHAATAEFLQGQCDAIGRQVKYHMQRAAAGGTGSAAASPQRLRPAIEAICRAMDRLHAARKIEVVVDVPGQLNVSFEAGDLFEVLSNLIDNAYKWACSCVQIGAHDEGQTIRITIADDGLGIDSTRRADALNAGTRLDSTVPGTGLGLAIANELVSLGRGSVRLLRSSDGGLLVEVNLPSGQ